VKIIKIYTDGSYRPDSDRGALAFLAITKENGIDKVIVENAESFDVDISINTIEIFCIIKALDWLISNGYSPKKYRFHIYTDSHNAFIGLSEQLPIWKKNNFKNKSNKEIWIYLNNHLEKFKSIHFHWIPSHDGNKWNERVDELCRIMLDDNLGKKIITNV
jgi:ribonuclease HI